MLLTRVIVQAAAALAIAQMGLAAPIADKYVPLCASPPYD